MFKIKKWFTRSHYGHAEFQQDVLKFMEELKAKHNLTDEEYNASMVYSALDILNYTYHENCKDKKSFRFWLNKYITRERKTL